MRSRKGFTLVELLVVISIIGILATLSFGALQLAQESAREAKTKATIAKLNNIIMRKYESYMTRRMPIQIPANTRPADAAQMRLDAIRDTMRMEMPERWPDIENMPTAFSWGSIPQPAKHIMYRTAYAAAKGGMPNANYSHAKCLYLIVSVGNPAAMEQFSQSEIAVDTDGLSYFVDGWGKPIYFLRWAPGASSTFANGFSGIQSGLPDTDHDPFDTRRVDSDAFHLMPLIFSYGRSGEPNIDTGSGSYYGNPVAVNWTLMDPFDALNVGEAADSSASGNITNHSIEQR